MKKTIYFSYLHLLLLSGNDTVALILVKRWADVNAENLDKKKPLHMAAENGKHRLSLARLINSHLTTNIHSVNRSLQFR